jgi:hypothetical protein
MRGNVVSERRLSAALSWYPELVEGLSKGSEAYRNQASDKGNWRRSLGISVALFLLALVPRVVGLNVFITPDECLWIERSGRFLAALLRADWAATFQVGHPGLTTRWTGVLGILATYLPRLQTVSGQLLIDDQPFQDLLTDLSVHLPEGLAAVRYPTAILTSMGVVGLYLLVRPLFGQRVALLSAVILALEPFYLALSRVIHHDALSTTFMALSLLSFMDHLRERRPFPYLVLSGLMAGLAFLSKAPSLFLVPFTVLLSLGAYLRRAGFHTCWRKGSLRPFDWRCVAELGRDWVVWGLIAALIFVLLWPAMWVDPLGTIAHMFGAAGELAEAGHRQFFFGRATTDPGIWFYPVVFLFRATPLTLAGVILGIIALVKAKDETRLAWPLAAYAVLFTLFISLSLKKNDRYLLPVFPALNILAAVGFWESARVIQQKFRSCAAAWVPKTCYLLPVSCLAVQAAFALPHHPYYLTYYNPVLGGAHLASRVLLVGWGEGLEQAARYLNAKEEMQKGRVLAWYSALGFNTLFRGESRELSPRRQPADDVWLWYESDYVVFYINQVQRGLPDARTLAFLRSLEPEYTVRLKGLEYAWVYKVPEAVPEDAYPFEQVTLVDLNGKVRLLGYDAGEVTVEADGRAYLPLTLYWQNLGPLDANYRLYLKLINGVYHIWGQQEGYPLWDGFMTSTWQEGVVIRDDRQIEVLPGTPPGAYQVTVNWLEPYSGLSLQPTGDGDLLLGPFDIPPRPPPSIESLGIEHPMTAELDGQVRFLGYNLEGDFRPGGDLHLTLFWQALTEMDENYTVFTHLIDGRGGIWGQKDNQPVDGFYPTGGWTAGEIVRDQYDLTISPETSPGLYRTAVGMYRAETGERLTVGQDGILPPDDKIVLGEFAVRSGE